MSVKIDSGGGYTATQLPNVDAGAVSQLQSTNASQPTGAAFNQFANVVSGDQATMHALAASINTLEKAKPNTLTAGQQSELTGDLQQYEKAAEKFNSDNAHLMQLAAADNSAPEVNQVATQGNSEGVNMVALYTSIGNFEQFNDNIAPSTSAALDQIGSSIRDQSNAAANNTAVGTSASQASSGGGGTTSFGTSSPGLVTTSSTVIAGQSGYNPIYLPNVDPSAVSSISSSNAGQPAGQAFNSFAQVVNADQGALTAIATSINSIKLNNPEALAGALQQYQKAAEKLSGDQAHLLQVAAADNNTGEVMQAIAGGKSAAQNMQAIQNLALRYASVTASTTSASTASTITSVANSIGDQAAAVANNSTVESESQGIADIGRRSQGQPFYVPVSTVTGGH